MSQLRWYTLYENDKNTSLDNETARNSLFRGVQHSICGSTLRNTERLFGAFTKQKCFVPYKSVKLFYTRGGGAGGTYDIFWMERNTFVSSEKTDFSLLPVDGSAKCSPN